jgi:dephospho-CoA kinase
MKIIGITGGVGAGKSQILSYLNVRYEAFVLQADQVAHQVMEPGEAAFISLVKLLGASVLNEKGEIDREKMATMIFSDHSLLCKVNQIIHPAVKNRIVEAIKLEKIKRL